MWIFNAGTRYITNNKHTSMKRILSLTLIIAAIFSLTSCVKTVETVPRPVVNPIAGSWYLYDASELYGNSWYSFNAGIDGILTFYENGNAQYDDGYSFMQGTWYTSYISDGYYDQYGNYYTDMHQDFQASVSNRKGYSLDLYFDDISFAGNNTFIGTYYTGKSIERYTFRRY